MQEPFVVITQNRAPRRIHVDPTDAPAIVHKALGIKPSEQFGFVLRWDSFKTYSSLDLEIPVRMLVVLENGGRPVAKLIPTQTFDALEGMGLIGRDRPRHNPHDVHYHRGIYVTYATEQGGGNEGPFATLQDAHRAAADMRSRGIRVIDVGVRTVAHRIRHNPTPKKRGKKGRSKPKAKKSAKRSKKAAPKKRKSAKRGKAKKSTKRSKPRAKKPAKVRHTTEKLPPKKDPLEALKRARAAADKAAPGSDGGSSNFDSTVVDINDARAFTTSMFRALGLNAHVGRYLGGKVLFISAPHGGQGFARTRQAEAMEKSLRADGYRAYVYYQMD